MRELKSEEIDLVSAGTSETEIARGAAGGWASTITGAAYGSIVAGPWGGIVGGLIGFAVGVGITAGSVLSGPVGITCGSLGLGGSVGGGGTGVGGCGLPAGDDS